MSWIELNATNPAPPAGAQNVHFRADETHLGTQADPLPVSAYIDRFTGDSGAGGASGLVPAPAVGDAASGKVLKADGTWYVPPDAAIVGVQQQKYTYAVDTGAANAYAVILTPVPTLIAGSKVVFRAANANTGASTLAVNGGAPTAITKQGSTALASGDIAAGQIVEVIYDGTNFQMIAGGGAASGGMANPMIDVGDLITGGTVTGGVAAPTRLSAGTFGNVLTSNGPGVAPSYQPGAGGRGLFSSIMSAVPTIASVGLTTAWNQTANFSAVDLADGILISDVSQATMWEGILRTYPTPPFTVVGMFTIPIDQGSFTNVLMAVVDTLTGKFMMLRREGGANGALSIYGATAPGSGGSYTSLFSKGSLFTSFFIFIKYVDDGTTIEISFSYDGQYWPASFTYSVAKASSYLGSGGFNYIGIGISPATAPTATQLMSWAQTSP